MKNINVKVLCEDYENGCSVQQTADKHNLSQITVRGYLRKEGVYSKEKSDQNMRAGCFYWHGKEEQMRADYESGIPLNTLCVKYKIAFATLTKVFIGLGVTFRTREEANHLACDFTYNANAFADFTEERAAYFYGFLLADGCWHGNRILCNLKATDIYILEQLKEYVGTQSTISVRTTTSTFSNQKKSSFTGEQCSFKFSSKILIDRLVSQGFAKRKSLHEKLPPAPLSLSRHLFRGLVDGDGSIRTYNGNPSSSASVFLCGSDEIITGFQTFVHHYFPNTKPAGRAVTKSGLHSITFTGQRARDILKLLYEDCEIYLPRKKVLADFWINKPDMRSKAARSDKYPKYNNFYPKGYLDDMHT